MRNLKPSKAKTSESDRCPHRDAGYPLISTNESVKTLTPRTAVLVRDVYCRDGDLLPPRIESSYHMRHVCLMLKIRPDTKDAIIEAAFQLFAEKPTASLGDLAKRAGVGRATLHRYFPGRPELMRALAKIAMEELDHAVEEATANAETSEEAFRLSLHASVSLASRQWFLAHQGVDADEEVAEIYNASLEGLRDDIEKAKEEGLFDRTIPTAWIAEVHENLTFAAWSLVRSGEATPKQAADLAWHTFSQGLKGSDR